MRKIVSFLIILLTSAICYADSIKCSNGTKIMRYDNVVDVTFTGELFVFYDKKGHKVVFTNDDCIVEIKV